MENVIEFKQVSQRIHWHTIISVAVFHIFAVWALFTFSWQNLTAALVLWWIAASWGVGIGFHRLLTHRGFKAPKWLEYFMSICGTLALQSGPLSWVTTHRIHHAFTETEKDPHSPRNGTYWAHIGWIFKGTAQHQSEAAMNRYTPDMAKDKFHIVLNKYYYLVIIAAAVGLFAIGGWSMVLWGVFLRVAVSWHFTWLVNSATHMWGSRRFETRDDSRNNGLVAAVTFGEGWHNNHHAHPRSARHGLTWREFDVNWMQLRILEKLGIISELYGYELEKANKETRQMKQAA